MMMKFPFRIALNALLIAIMIVLPSWNRERKWTSDFVAPSVSLCGRIFNELLQAPDGPVPIYEGLGDLHYGIVTESQLAQKYFDQGLRLIYGFNHYEALRAFREASRLDPTCAMSYWGQALALGPNINDINPKEREEMANNAMIMARKFSAKAPQKEKDLIHAMSSRFDGKAYADREPLNTSYANAMSTLAEKYPRDTEVLTLFADALMMGSPWDYYQPDGSPKQSTIKARRALETATMLNPGHPGAHHLYIHLLEASPKPEEALKSAELLETAMPAAGHIVHMPSHIYVRTGHYDRSNISNTNAIKADEEFLSYTNDQGMYRVFYYPHNLDFMNYGAMMSGESQKAIQNGGKLAYQMKPVESMMPIYYDFFITVPVLTYVRFGMWNEILALPDPNPQHFYSVMISHYARGTAYLRKGRLKEAALELHLLDSVSRLDTLKSLQAFYTPTDQIALVPVNLLKGELAIANGQTEEGLKSLRNAVIAEDKIRYNEPPDWRLPARHFLGAALAEGGNLAEAQKVFEEDLKINPANGWALNGLLSIQLKLGQTERAKQTRTSLDEVWKHNDVKPAGARF